MAKVTRIKSDSPLAKIMNKMIADKKVINQHIARGGTLADWKSKRP